MGVGTGCAVVLQQARLAGSARQLPLPGILLAQVHHDRQAVRLL